MSAAQARRCRGAPIYSMICASSSGAAGSRPPSIPRAIMASSCASDIRSVTGGGGLELSRYQRCNHAHELDRMRPRRCHQRWLAECAATPRADRRRNSSLSLLREPFGRPLGLPDWPGLNWVNSLPVTCFPPVDSGLRLTISVHRIGFTGRSLHRTARDQPSIKPALTGHVGGIRRQQRCDPECSGCGTPHGAAAIHLSRKSSFFICRPVTPHAPACGRAA